MPWQIEARKGFWLPQIGWHLDATDSAPRGIVSHAHADHIGRHREIVCSAPTARFLRERIPGRREYHILPYGAPEQLTLDCTVTLFPAGHILGSSLVLLEHREHGRLLYTGDFRLRPAPTVEPCATPAADVLVMETTFGLPRYVMPPTDMTHAAIVDFCRRTLADGATPVLHAYTLGKSQELAFVLNRAGLPAMLPADAWRLAQIYRECGVDLPQCHPFNQRDHAGHVVIAPPGSPILQWIHPRRTAAVTGWAIDSATRYRMGCDEMFALSDHADHEELLTFAGQVRPRTIYTVHGFAREFAATLRQRGFDAWALGRANQLELSL